MKKTVCVILFMMAMVACSTKSAEYKELSKNGKVHEAQIVDIDSVEGVCTYRLIVDDKEFYGHCQQRTGDKTPFLKDQIILVVYLERNPSINRRLSDN